MLFSSRNKEQFTSKTGTAHAMLHMPDGDVQGCHVSLRSHAQRVRECVVSLDRTESTVDEILYISIISQEKSVGRLDQLMYIN